MSYSSQIVGDILTINVNGHKLEFHFASDKGSKIEIDQGPGRPKEYRFVRSADQKAVKAALDATFNVDALVAKAAEKNKQPLQAYMLDLIKTMEATMKKDGPLDIGKAGNTQGGAGFVHSQYVIEKENGKEILKGISKPILLLDPATIETTKFLKFTGVWETDPIWIPIVHEIFHYVDPTMPRLRKESALAEVRAVYFTNIARSYMGRSQRADYDIDPASAKPNEIFKVKDPSIRVFPNGESWPSPTNHSDWTSSPKSSILGKIADMLNPISSANADTRPAWQTNMEVMENKEFTALAAYKLGYALSTVKKGSTTTEAVKQIEKIQHFTFDEQIQLYSDKSDLKTIEKNSQSLKASYRSLIEKNNHLKSTIEDSLKNAGDMDNAMLKKSLDSISQGQLEAIEQIAKSTAATITYNNAVASVFNGQKLIMPDNIDVLVWKKLDLVDQVDKSIFLNEDLVDVTQNITLPDVYALNPTVLPQIEVVGDLTGISYITGLGNYLAEITQSVFDGFNNMWDVFTGLFLAGDETQISPTSPINYSSNAKSRTFLNLFANKLKKASGNEGDDVLVSGYLSPGGKKTTISGGGGSDYIIGGSGNDILSGDDGNDLLEGRDGKDDMKGGSGADVLFGGGGSDLLDGGVGADTLFGGDGDDTYFVNLLSDKVVEYEKAGIDTVKSTSDFVLPSNVENLVLLNEGGSISGYGNDLSNKITGNDHDNYIYGGGGKDTMSGGKGNDIYVVDNAGDKVSEAKNAGNDTVVSSVTYKLSANVENLTLVGAGNINGTGNKHNNVLKGNSGKNDLSGGGNKDLLQGMKGNDTLNGGNGNDLLDGGAGNDMLDGGAGNDLFVGGLGNDTVMNLKGRNTIAFNKGDGSDIIKTTKGANDTISIGGGIRYKDLSLSKSGRDLVLKAGNSDQITFQDWYKSKSNHSVVNLQVIAEAMSSFAQGGKDSLRNNKIKIFDFAGLVKSFDASGAKAGWALTDARLKAHLTDSKDTAALGGDLAYQYGKAGTLAGMGVNAAQSVIGDKNFGKSAQALHSPNTWQSELVTLG